MLGSSIVRLGNPEPAQEIEVAGIAFSCGIKSALSFAAFVPEE
jgi:hypothetical protein